MLKLITLAMKKNITRFLLLCGILFGSFSAYGQNYVDFGYGVDTYCAPSNITFYDYSSIAPQGTAQYKWYIDFNLVSTAASPSGTFSVGKGLHYLTLEIFDSFDLSLLGTITYTLEIEGKITDFRVSGGTQLCPGQEIEFSVDQAYYVTWDFGYSSYFIPRYSTENYPRYVYDKPGIYNVTLIAESYCGSDTVQKLITVSNTAKPNITASDIIVEAGCINDPVKFTASGDFLSYLWEFGDGATSNAIEPQHTYKSDIITSYSAKLTVTNSCGGSTTVNFPVQIEFDVPANASFTYSVLNNQDYCPGSPVRFEPFGSGSYFWDFGDGSTSTEKNPEHIFTQMGDYSVSLTVTNGCNDTQTSSNYVNIYTGETYVPYPYFNFGLGYNQQQSETLNICPSTQVNFINETYSEPGINYTWDFGDGTSYFGYNATHNYQIPGSYTVILTSSNLCGQTNYAMKFINVDAGTVPSATLSSVPGAICAGDKVYFWDNEFDIRNNLTYSVTFGDGTSANNIKSLEDPELQILATHVYNTGGPYTYTFSAFNTCGNSKSLNGVITVDNNPARKPFYYVENSTEDNNYSPPSDWSARHNPSDYEISIPLSWPGWQAGYGNEFYILLWYGSVDAYYLSSNGYPDGFVKVTTPAIVSGISVKAYIPVDPIEQMSVGIAGAYYCGGTPRWEKDPDVAAPMTDSDYIEVYNIPIIPAGITDLSSMFMEVILDPYYYWDGICKTAKLDGTWNRNIEPGVFAHLELYPGDGDMYTAAYTDAAINYNKYNELDWGGYYTNQTGDTLYINSWYGICAGEGQYKVLRSDENTLQFIVINDPCSDRQNFLSGTFNRAIENPSNYLAVCPGDKIKFKVAGGVSYLWNFGDGTTSTLQFPFHSYSAPGNYDARVIATNSCGRKDTLYTTARVVANKPIDAYFYVPEHEKVSGDSIHFSASTSSYSMVDNNTYLWTFGDGTSSTLKNPVHVYFQPKDYMVKLTVTNGCGSFSYSEAVTITPKLRLCDAQFDYWVDGPAGFIDKSSGNPTSWTWDFGDGTVSTVQSPTHSYTRDGVYTVSLTVFNVATKCFSSVSRRISIGNVPCQSDFDFVINKGSGVATFTSKSQGATDYYWNFGDGKFSSSANPNHTYAKTGIYNVCLTIKDVTSGCSSVSCKKVVFIPVDQSYVEANFSFFTNPDNLEVRFSNLSSANSTSWYWTMGDGKVIKNQDFVYTYAKPGIYNVCLTAYDAITAKANTICKSVRVGNLGCTVGSDFTFFINPVSQEVQFYNSSYGPFTNCFWSFGDGKSSKAINPIHSYSKPGYYKISLAVRNSVDQCMDEFTRMVQVGTVDCQSEFEFRVNPDNNTVNFLNESNGNIAYYYWDFGDGTFSVLENPDHLYKKLGLYKASLTVMDNLANCVDYSVQNVQVGDVDCSAEFITYVDSSTSTAYFTNQVQGKSTALLWSFGDGTFSTNLNPSHRFPAAGFYSTGLNTYDINSGCMDYYEEMMLIGDIGIDCNADFFYSVDASSQVTFSNRSTGDIVDVIWNFGDDSDNSTELNPVHTYTKAGYYYVCLNIVNSQGIKSMGCKWVKVQENVANACRANFMFSIDSVQRKVKFADKSFGDIDSYSWDFGDNRSDSVSYEKNPVHTYDQKGYYMVRLKAENTATGCVSIEYKLLNVSDAQVLKAAFGYDALNPDKKRAGYPVDMVSSSSGDGATVEWDFGDKNLKKAEGFTIMDSTSKIVTHYYLVPGKYYVCLRISDPVTEQSDEYCEWVYTKFMLGTDINEPDGINLNIYPNPFINYTNIDFSVPDQQFVEIGIYDQLGRRIQTLVKGRKDSGNYQLTWETKSLTTGVYHLKMVTERGIITRQLVITK